MAARDYGMTGGIVARANELQRIAQEQMDRAKAQAEREQERLEAMKGPSPAEAAAERDRKHREAQEAKAEKDALALRIKLKNRYRAADPSASDDDFNSAYPALLKAHREQAVLGGSAEVEIPDNSFHSPKFWGL